MKCLLLDDDFFLENLPPLIYAFQQVKSRSEIVDLKTHFSLRIIPVVNQFFLKPSVPTDIVLLHNLNYSVVSDDLFYQLESICTVQCVYDCLSSEKKRNQYTITFVT